MSERIPRALLVAARLNISALQGDQLIAALDHFDGFSLNSRHGLALATAEECWGAVLMQTGLRLCRSKATRYGTELCRVELMRVEFPTSRGWRPAYLVIEHENNAYWDLTVWRNQGRAHTWYAQRVGYLSSLAGDRHYFTETDLSSDELDILIGTPSTIDDTAMQLELAL